jgi:CheY-like chemotaxis protein
MWEAKRVSGPSFRTLRFEISSKGYFIMGCVLIVVDHFASRDVLRQLVEKDGRAVLTACDGRDALECARSIPPPSVILLDLSMPIMNGWEFLQHKNADPTIAGIPTIVSSGSFTDLPAGTMNLLTKPVDIERLLALIEQYC